MCDRYILYVVILKFTNADSSKSPPQILVLSTMHKELQQKLGNLCVFREFNGVDYSASLYGSCYCPCYGKLIA